MKIKVALDFILLMRPRGGYRHGVVGKCLRS